MLATRVAQAEGARRRILKGGQNCLDMPSSPEIQSKSAAATKKTLVELLEDTVVYVRTRRKKLLAELKAAKETK